jgi:hypothetical protein
MYKVNKGNQPERRSRSEASSYDFTLYTMYFEVLFPVFGIIDVRNDKSRRAVKINMLAHFLKSNREVHSLFSGIGAQNFMT